MIGQLHIDGDVRLGGTVEGQVEATGDVDIDDEAKVTASLAGRDVNIRGHVNGHVTARKRLTVAKSGSLNGDVRVARLVIQDGASFSGNVSMGAVAEAAPKPQPIVAPALTPAAATPPSAAPEAVAPLASRPAAPATPAPPATPVAREGNRQSVERGGGKPEAGKAKAPGATPAKGKPKR